MRGHVGAARSVSSSSRSRVPWRPRIRKLLHSNSRSTHGSAVSPSIPRHNGLEGSEFSGADDGADDGERALVAIYIIRSLWTTSHALALIVTEKSLVWKELETRGTSSACPCQ